ncbi:unnamed protein product [Tuber aestivum]|uniref:Uncharacterized protein n=1 Tax=Tuber aestivum TaxID=59557 RepID=A0A292PRZ7_9PEZI|nr:unnamed protein product [Tuber aestivum]
MRIVLPSIPVEGSRFTVRPSRPLAHRPNYLRTSVHRTVGLARLLVLEALPEPETRDAYVRQRKEEMGRPMDPYASLWMNKNRGDKKQGTDGDLAEWNFEDISNYEKFSIPYGPGYDAKKGVVVDCCGFCPELLSDDEKKVQEQEDVMYIRGDLEFLKDDPGRQEIDSFYPRTLRPNSTVPS